MTLRIVHVNGKKATVDNGEYSARIMLGKWKNEIKVMAYRLGRQQNDQKVTVIDVNFESAANFRLETGRR